MGPVGKRERSPGTTVREDRQGTDDPLQINTISWCNHHERPPSVRDDADMTDSNALPMHSIRTPPAKI